MSVALRLLALASCLRPVVSYQFYQRYLPNGDKVSVNGFRWYAIGHVLPDAYLPQLARNDFGRAFAKAGYRWTEELCRMDSDGDGRTNGEELGDPDCTWRYDEPHPAAPEEGLSHPGVDERVVPFDALQVLHNSTGRLRFTANWRESPSHQHHPKNATASWSAFYDMLPPRDAPVMDEEAFELRIGNRILFSLYFAIFPALCMVAVGVRHKYNIAISLWGWLAAHLSLFTGVSIGSHRLFSHNAFVPARWFKLLLIFLGTMSGQGEPRYWAVMHRQHHNRCEELGDDPHAAALELERGLGFAHGGFLYDRLEHYMRDIEQRAPDLMDADHELFGNGRSIALFILLPLLLGNLASLVAFYRSSRAPPSGQGGAASGGAVSVRERMYRAVAVGFTSVSFYFYLPATMVWHASMLINSAVHTVGYSLYKDAMSEACTATNLPLLFPYMLGEQNHNNHHAEPSAISTWHLWWEVDLIPLVIRALEACGAVVSSTPARLSRAYPGDPLIGALRGRVDLMDAPYHNTTPGLTVFESERVTPLPISVQLLLVVLFYIGVICWRRAALQRRTLDWGVSFVLVSAGLLSIGFAAAYALLSVEMRDPTAERGAALDMTRKLGRALHAAISTPEAGASSSGPAFALRFIQEAPAVASLALAYVGCVGAAVGLAFFIAFIAFTPAWACMSLCAVVGGKGGAWPRGKVE